jgi:threonine/homoserine/homoserine lactone efflux protein
MGFLEAIPVGATQLEIARRCLNGFFSSALMIIVGAVLSDAMYGAVALWGVAPFLQDPSIVPYFWLVGGAATAIVGVWAIREGHPHRIPNERSSLLMKSHKVAFITGFSLAITNPFMIAYWLIGAHLLNNFGIIKSTKSSDVILFIIAGSLGIGSYSVVLATGVYKAKRFFSERSIRRITFIFGLVLLAMASYFTSKATILFLGR